MLVDCDGALGLRRRSRAPANHCSNPVSSFTRSMIDYFGARSCSEIVCMSYFMHVAPCCLPACLLACLRLQCQDWRWDSERASVLVSGSSRRDSDDIWATHTPQRSLWEHGALLWLKPIMHQQTPCCAPSNPITALLMASPAICASLIGWGSDWCALEPIPVSYCGPL